MVKRGGLKAASFLSNACDILSWVFTTSVLNFTSGKRLPKVQIITIEELLNGKKIEYPTVGTEVTFKKAEGREKRQ